MGCVNMVPGARSIVGVVLLGDSPSGWKKHKSFQQFRDTSVGGSIVLGWLRDQTRHYNIVQLLLKMATGCLFSLQ